MYIMAQKFHHVIAMQVAEQVYGQIDFKSQLRQSSSDILACTVTSSEFSSRPTCVYSYDWKLFSPVITGYVPTYLTVRRIAGTGTVSGYQGIAAPLANVTGAQP